MNPYTVTNEMVDSILAAAFEGGITYWAVHIEVIGDDFHGAEFASDAVSRGGKLRVYEFPDEDEFVGKSHILRLANIKRGIKKAAELRGQTVEAFYEDHDADSADLAVQFALFGEVVYG